MRESYAPPRGGRESVYIETLKQLGALLAEDDDLIAALANSSALLKLNFPSFSWVGFYLTRGRRLVLGPFQGKPACVTIGLGKGVCGVAAATGKTQIVEDVDVFPGHIACDPLSRSEIVVPIQVNGEVVGLLDVDSENSANFGETDKKYLERVVELLVPRISQNLRSKMEAGE